MMDEHRLSSALGDINRLLRNIRDLIGWIAVLLGVIFLALAFPDWRGTLG